MKKRRKNYNATFSINESHDENESNQTNNVVVLTTHFGSNDESYHWCLWSSPKKYNFFTILNFPKNAEVLHSLYFLKYVVTKHTLTDFLKNEVNMYKKFQIFPKIQ